MPTNQTRSSDQFDVTLGTTNILLIAPHGCFRNGKYKNDAYTGPITKEAARHLNCKAIINSRFLKPNLKNPRSLENENLDLNLVQDAELVPDFLNFIRTAVDQPGKTIVVWIHGAADSSVDAIAKANGFKAKPQNLHAIIGFGQGENPRVPIKERKGLDKESRPSTTDEAINAFIEALAKNGMTAIPTPDDANNFRGRDPGRMNQWFLNEGYTFDQVESIQLEIRKRYRTKSKIQPTAKMLAGALAIP